MVEGDIEVLPIFGQVAKVCSELNKETQEWVKKGEASRRVSRRA